MLSEKGGSLILVPNVRQKSKIHRSMEPYIGIISLLNAVRLDEWYLHASLRAHIK